MNNLYLTSTFASLFTLFYLFLSFRIGYFRGSPVMKLIFKMDEEIPDTKLQRNVRAHGNFSEYVPIFLILLLTMEILGQSSFNYLLMICLIFLYGRLAHAICFAFYDSNPFLRISGMLCTYLGLGIFAIQLLFGVIRG
ncbi:MAG: glutathione S-transferase [Magnetovibrio sp.]|nr:glutathione S-transferase [Magnetovibrio sp.]